MESQGKLHNQPLRAADVLDPLCCTPQKQMKGVDNLSNSHDDVSDTLLRSQDGEVHVSQISEEKSCAITSLQAEMYDGLTDSCEINSHVLTGLGEAKDGKLLSSDTGENELDNTGRQQTPEGLGRRFNQAMLSWTLYKLNGKSVYMNELQKDSTFRVLSIIYFIVWIFLLWFSLVTLTDNINASSFRWGRQTSFYPYTIFIVLFLRCGWIYRYPLVFGFIVITSKFKGDTTKYFYEENKDKDEDILLVNTETSDNLDEERISDKDILMAMFFGK